MSTYTLLIDDGRSGELPEVFIDAADDAEARQLAEVFLSARPSAQRIVVMRRSLEVAIVARLQ